MRNNTATKAAANASRSLSERKRAVVWPTTRGYAWWADTSPWRDTPRGSGKIDKRRSAKAERSHAKLTAWAEAE